MRPKLNLDCFNLYILLIPICLITFAAGANADFVIGYASNYGVIAGPNTTSIQFSNGTYNGNIATDNANPGSNYVQFSSGTINGNFSFAGSAQANLGSGTLTGSKIANDPNVSSAYNTISTLSSTFAGEATNGAAISTSTIDAVNGYHDATGNYVYTTTATNFLTSALTINGTANQYVVIDVTGNFDVQLKSTLSLTGGITDDHVFINITGSGKQVGGNTNGGIVNGLIVALNDKFNIDNTTIDGRVIGGSNQDFQLVSNFTLNTPAVSTPLPGILPGSLMLLGMVFAARRVRSSVV